MWGTVGCLWDSQGLLSFPPDFGRGDEVLSGCLWPDLRAGGAEKRPCQDECQTSQPRSMGQAWELCTLPAEANQFFWQVEAGWILEPFPGNRLVLRKAASSCLFVPTFTQGWESRI